MGVKHDITNIIEHDGDVMFDITIKFDTTNMFFMSHKDRNEENCQKIVGKYANN